MKETEKLLRETLSDAARQAPEELRLESGAAPVGQPPRRWVPLLAAGLAAVLVVLAVVVAQQVAGSRDETQPVGKPKATAPDHGSDRGNENPTPDGPAPTLPDGWRWESYGGIQVGVPASWGWDNSSQRISQWCIEHNNAAHPNPAVGRPGPATTVGCFRTNEDDSDPSTLIKNAGIFVGFSGWLDGPRGVVEEGDRTTVTIGTTSVMVQAEQPLRDKIVATVHEVGVDAYGCPATDPVSEHPQARPSPAIPVGDLESVTSVSVCKYSLSYSKYIQTSTPPMLISSTKLEGTNAAAAIAGIATAPVGSGPNSADTCLAEVGYGDDQIVLRVTSAAGDSEVYLRYSGCDHNGFDDGADTYQLTADAVAPFVTGPNQVTSYSGLGKEGLF
jgi:hypothetical protein